MTWGGDWNWGARVAMTLTMLGFWALVIWAVANFVRATGTGGPRR